MKLNVSIEAKVERDYHKPVREAVTKLINISSLSKIRCSKLLKPMDQEVNGILRIQSSNLPQAPPRPCAQKASHNRVN